MSKEKRRVPKLRFPGFAEDWEQRKLGEIFEYLQNNTLSRDSLNYKNPNIKNIHYGDILVKFDEILDGSNKDIPYINSELDLSKFSKSLLRDGDIVFSDTAEDDAVGKAIELQNVSAPFVLSGLHTIPCRPLIPFGKGYLGNFLNSDSYRMQLRPLVQGIKVSSISKSALKDTMIVYPKKLDEQEKIGGLFYHISKMITLHQRKLNNLKLKKKALLQKLFPKNGERYPELRFPGFTDAWEQRKFGDLFEYERPDAYIVKSDNYNDDFNMPVLTANKAFILGYTNEENSYNKPSIIFDDFTLDRKYVDFPYMLKSSAIKILTSKNQHNLRFLFERLNSTRFELLGHARHYISVVQNTITFCPSVEEEVCISNLLTKFDELITLHQRKLDHLQLQKKALLQQMFV